MLVAAAKKAKLSMATSTFAGCYISPEITHSFQSKSQGWAFSRTNSYILHISRILSAGAWSGFRKCWWLERGPDRVHDLAASPLELSRLGQHTADDNFISLSSVG